MARNCGGLEQIISNFPTFSLEGRGPFCVSITASYESSIRSLPPACCEADVWIGRTMLRRHVIVRTALGLLLLTAAGLKLYGLGVSAVPRVGWFAQPWVQLTAAEWEIVLGLWLLSGAYPLGAWVAALGKFVAFAGVSGYLGAVGVASCGCFG